jgi:hypothetical protein
MLVLAIAFTLFTAGGLNILATSNNPSNIKILDSNAPLV